MSRFAKLCSLVMTLLLLPVLGNCAEDALSGCATAKELLTREVAAIQRNDSGELARCFSSYVRITPQAAAQGAAPYLLTHAVQNTVIDGVKKYGAKEFAVALGNMRAFYLLSWLTTPQELMVKKGTLTVQGDTASYSYSWKGEPADAAYYAQTELKEYVRLFHDPNFSGELTLDLEKVNGRWYQTISQRDTDALCQANTLLTDYLPAVNTGIQQCATAKALSTFLAEANAKFDKTLSSPAAEAAKE